MAPIYTTRSTPSRLLIGLTAFVAAACSTAGQASAPTIDLANPSAAVHVQASESPVAPPASAAPMTEAVVAPERTVEESGGFRLVAQSSASCTADAPADWAMSAPDRSDRADLYSLDGSLYAGYGIQAINTTLAPYAGVYDAPLNDPDLYSTDPATVAIAYGRIVVGGIGGAPDIVGDELYQPADDYLLATVTGSTHQGAVLFHATGFAGDGLNYAYALPMYFAFATHDRWAPMGPLVARVAASIRCTTQLQPPDDYFWVEAGEAGAAVDANGDEEGYNPQLGTEYVNDPTTGENYLVDPSLNWSETGPDGSGYYVPKGNDHQKLEPGRVD
jgi:hypothetical protein